MSKSVLEVLFQAVKELVGLQLALSLVVLSACGLFLRSIQNARQMDPGFDSRDLLIVSLGPENQPYTALKERIAAMPGVKSVSLAHTVPLTGVERADTVHMEGRRPERVGSGWVDADYFATLGIPLLRGRSFQQQDANVVVLNETMARRFFPEGNAVGAHIRLQRNGPLHEIVGIARDGKYWSIGETPRAFLYRPIPGMGPGMHLAVRAPVSLAATLRRELGTEVRTMTQIVDAHLGPARSGATLLGAFGLLAVLLAAAGVYGMMSYAVARRTQEIGVRMALGAEAGDVLRLVLRHGWTVAALGVAGGIAGAIAATRVVSSLLIGVSPTDPATLAAVSILMVGIALLAAFLPARHAAKVDPVAALRHE